MGKIPRVGLHILAIDRKAFWIQRELSKNCGPKAHFLLGLVG